MGHSDKLMQAVDNFTSDENELSLEDRIFSLGSDIMANAFFLIDKNLRGQKTTDAEEAAQAEMNKRYKEITTTYASLQKINKKVSNQQSFDSEILKKIKDRQSSISSIVVANTNGDDK